MIEAIIVDLGGVYCQRGTKIAIQEYHRILGIPIEKLKRAFIENDAGVKDLKLGRIDDNEFWVRVSDFLNINFTDELKDTWHKAYAPNVEVRNLIRKLRDDGYKIATISGNVPGRVAYLNREFQMEDDFDEHTYSFEVGFNKPDKRMYELILEKLHLRGNQCVYIDDEPKRLPPAEELGMKTILYLDPTQLKKELVKLGIKVN